MARPKDPKTIWDARYARYKQRSSAPRTESWLSAWHEVLTEVKAASVLELGCGQGEDTRQLEAYASFITAVDYSCQALSIAVGTAKGAALAQVDFRDGVPFASGSFSIVVASLTLHYFPWQVTQQIVSDIQRLLLDDGYLLARFNASNDVNYGAIGHEAVEPGLFLVKGELKRFFDRPMLLKLFRQGWRIHHMTEKTIERYQKPKAIWEVLLQKETR